MTAALSVAAPGEFESSAFEELLRLTDFVDAVHYRSQAGGADDPVAHYARIGWRIGLSPNPRFEADFLAPHYRAAGLFEPPALIWLGLTAAGVRLPSRRTEAEPIAAMIAGTGLFEPEAYPVGLPDGIDPVLHYVVIGEALGWRVSSWFDPVHYLDANPDVRAEGTSPLLHFGLFGMREGRSGLSGIERLPLPPLPASDRPTVLLISHEASRTGAPVLGWNLARGLAGRAQIVSLLLRGGELEEDFADVSDVLIGPLTAEFQTPAALRVLARRIVEAYRPVYAIANSVATAAMVPALARWGVPSVALVHEFASQYEARRGMRDVFEWAPHVVFPAGIVARASFKAFGGLEERPGLHILPQGPSALPPSRTEGPSDETPDLDRFLIRAMEDGAFLVVGMGVIDYRKGVDAFLATAGAARRLRPDLPLRFLWIGDHVDRVEEGGYSSYIEHQVAQSDLEDVLLMHPAVGDLDPVYAAAGALFLSSRLDPQPNVAIDALIRGVPTICFRGAGGTAEVLERDPVAASLAVPYQDIGAAAAVICRLAADRKAAAALRPAIAQLARRTFDAAAYLDALDRLGRAAAAALPESDRAILAAEGGIEPDYALPPLTPVLDWTEVEWRILQQWHAVGLSRPIRHMEYRRPIPGFNPHVYAASHAEACAPGRGHPLVHWLRSGRPKGRWARDVFRPTRASENSAPLRCALHVHVYYDDLLEDLAIRLGRNGRRCDLFVTTDTPAKAAQARRLLGPVAARLELAVLPNRGRDLGPFLIHVLPEVIRRGYAVVGHVHTKKTPDELATLGTSWRNFLWENLIGGEEAMLDRAAGVFLDRSDLGLLMAEDPHMIGWDKNRTHAEALAARMGLASPLPEHFDFPLGTMFWARPKALAPLADLALGWDDMPDEPIPRDGTVLHALERLMPLIVEKAGYQTGGLWVPGTTW